MMHIMAPVLGMAMSLVLAVIETALGALDDPLKIEAGLAEGWALLLVFKLPSTVSSWLVCVTIAAVAALRVGVLLDRDQEICQTFPE